MPAPERPAGAVIVDTTPIIALSVAGRLDLLRDLYSSVLIPPAVQAEVMAGGASGAGIAELKAAAWVSVAPLTDPRRADLLSDLHRGEAEVLALAQELSARLVILDERLARRHAVRLGFELTGTLGVLLRAKQQSLLTEIKPLVEVIRRSGVHLAPVRSAKPSSQFSCLCTSFRRSGSER